ncbi:MAG: type IV secretory system conjugative DNA transfer family protein [Dehalococcoidia bacterium]
MAHEHDGRHAPETPQELVEVVTPRTNAAMITPAENLLAAISLPEPFSLEIAATDAARWFLIRAGSAGMRRHLEDQLAVAYPQAELRRLDTARFPDLDPARSASGEQVAACALTLRGPQYLPLRTFRDADVEASRAPQADPILGILGALGDLPSGWRGLAQLVLRPAPDDWCKGYLRFAVEHPLAAERIAARPGSSLTSVALLAGLLVVSVIAFQAHQWYAARDWLSLLLLAGGVAAGGPGLVWLGQRLTDRPIYDVRLVQEKVSRIAYLTELRLAIFAPVDAPGAEVEARLLRLAAAYRQFNLAAGNGLVSRRLDPRGRDLPALAPLGSRRATPVLNTRELAGLWHLPQAGADVPLLERTAARRRLPLPITVARGCGIGVSTHQGRAVPVALPDDLLRRHLLLVAKTRRGKSSLLLRLAQHSMEAPGPGGARPALVLVDPHRDLARAALGLVPTTRRDDVIFLDVGERERPFGLNLLDTGLFRDRDKAVANALAVFKREFDRFWGPRMEDAFRFALLTLYEANQTICVADPDGRSRQHTILEVPAVLVDTAFRRGLLGLITDPVITAWWSGYFDRLDRRLQVEISNPVQTKVQRFAGSRAARAIVGQPRSTIDPEAWLRSGAVVIINAAKGTVGEDTAALIGATLLNLIALTVGEQAGLDVRQRRPVTLLVDEFHAMPGTDYEAILAELAKYGANLVLATQSLAQLAALDREQHRALRSVVFANLDGLFAFHCSAEDARYLVPELGEEVDEQDLVGLGEHQCYARISAGGERLPTFSVYLDPPPTSDPDLADALAAASRRRYGRDVAAVERDLRSAFARIELSRHSVPEQRQAGQAGAGIAKGASTTATVGQPAEPKPGRNDHRRQKRRRAEAHQATLFEPSTPGGTPARSDAERGAANG